MSSNPYKSSPLAPPTSADKQHVSVGLIGFGLALVGFLGLFFASAAAQVGGFLGTMGLCVPFLSLPGLVLSLIGFFRNPEHWSGWGVVLGLIAGIYLPTIGLAFR